MIKPYNVMKTQIHMVYLNHTRQLLRSIDEDIYCTDINSGFKPDKSVKHAQIIAKLASISNTL